MDIVRRLRDHRGLTQQEFAERASTSQSTIAAYETGRKSPTVRTITKLCDAVQLDMHIVVTSKLTREDRRSLAFHRAIVDSMENEPIPIRDKAKSNLKRLTALHPNAAPLLHEWKLWLEMTQPCLVENMLSTSEHAREMRQVSPFSGVLTAGQRAEVIKQFRRDNDE